MTPNNDVTTVHKNIVTSQFEKLQGPLSEAVQ